MANRLFDTLKHIIQDVNNAPGLDDALNIIVHRIKHELSADAVSVYFRNQHKNELILMATDGLNTDAIGQIKFKSGEGLVGQIADSAKVINLRDAHNHPNYRFVTQTDEASFHGFLGVPIIQRGHVLGVLVVRQKTIRKFSDNSEAFLVTLAAQLSGAISHAQSTGDITRLFNQTPGKTLRVEGIKSSPGIAIGVAHIAYDAENLEAVPDIEISNGDIENQISEFRKAIDNVVLEYTDLSNKMQGLISSEELALFDAFSLMLKSDSLINSVIDNIKTGISAKTALRITINDHVRQFQDMDDAYLRERAVDIKDLGRRILAHLQSGQAIKQIDTNTATVLIGEEVVVSQFSEIPLEHLKAIVSRKGSASSHVAILANALGIPCIMGAESIPVNYIDQQPVIVDGNLGILFIRPGKALLEEYELLISKEEKLDQTLNSILNEPSTTLDGVHIPLYVNTGLLADISASLKSGAEGVGLYRTEIPFLVRDGFPGEDEQIVIYKEILREFSPKPVVFRTLDIGGDKTLPYFPVIEDNPFLGWRGIRIMLDHPEIFITQLRAILKSNIYNNNLRLMLPMISSVNELDQTLELIKQVYNELTDHGLDIQFPSIGVMIEVPSAIFQIPAFAKRVDFFSIGTNDLTQYLLAVDRNNSQVSDLYDYLDPSVIMAINQIIQVAHANHKTVSVCGEMAGDPISAFILVALGVDSLSMNAGNLLKVKWMIRSFSNNQANLIIKKVLKLESASEIRQFLNKELANITVTNSL